MIDLFLYNVLKLMVGIDRLTDPGYVFALSECTTGVEEQCATVHTRAKLRLHAGLTFCVGKLIRSLKLLFMNELFATVVTRLLCSTRTHSETGM